MHSLVGCSRGQETFKPCFHLMFPHKSATFGKVQETLYHPPKTVPIQGVELYDSLGIFVGVFAMLNIYDRSLLAEFSGLVFKFEHLLFSWTPKLNFHGLRIQVRVYLKTDET